MTSDFLTDDDIVADLREEIRRGEPKPAPPKTAAEWQDVIRQARAEYKHPLDFSTIREWKRKPEPKKKRVPRMWWGWILIVWRWIKGE